MRPRLTGALLALAGAATVLALQLPLPATAGRAILGTSGKDTLRGTNGDNRFGPDPKGTVPAQAFT